VLGANLQERDAAVEKRPRDRRRIEAGALRAVDVDDGLEARDQTASARLPPPGFGFGA
jgi:hypothetical protein